MNRRNYFLAVGMIGALSASVIAKPPGGPTNPHGNGKEQTPIERDFHVPPAAEPRLTDAVPTLPLPRKTAEVWVVLRLALPWLKGINVSNDGD